MKTLASSVVRARPTNDTEPLKCEGFFQRRQRIHQTGNANDGEPPKPNAHSGYSKASRSELFGIGRV